MYILKYMKYFSVAEARAKLAAILGMAVGEAILGPDSGATLAVMSRSGSQAA